MDLYEYQAKDLFAAHGVPVLPGRTVETPEEAAAAAARAGRDRGRQGPGQDRWPGQGGWGEAGEHPEEAQEKAAAILGLDIKGHTVHRVLVTAGQRHREEYYFSFLLDRATARSWRCARPRAAWRSSSSPSSGRTRWPASTWTRSPGVDKAKAAEIVGRGEDPGGGGRPGRGRHRQAVGDLRRRGRHAGRGQPAGARPAGPRRRPRRQGHPGRQRRLPAPGARRPGRRARPRTRWRPRPRPSTSTTSSSTTAGRDHRQRCGPGDVHAGRGGLRR